MDRLPNDVIKMVYRYLYDIVLKTLNVELCTLTQCNNMNKHIYFINNANNGWVRTYVYRPTKLILPMYIEDFLDHYWNRLCTLDHQRVSIINGNIYFFIVNHNKASGRLVLFKSNISHRHDELIKLQINYL